MRHADDGRAVRVTVETFHPRSASARCSVCGFHPRESAFRGLAGAAETFRPGLPRRYDTSPAKRAFPNRPALPRMRQQKLLDL